MRIKVIIRHQTYNYTIEVQSSDTVGNLKKLISEIVHIDPKKQILLCNDKVLNEDKKNIEELEIKDNSIIFIKEEKQKSNFMANPEYMKSMIKMMPQMQEDLEENQQLQAFMNSANFQEEIANMTSDPNYLKEQMKNFDLTVSKLENMPGGFNMINSMMKDVHDPVMNIFSNGMRGSNYKEGGQINTPINDPLPKKTTKQNLLLQFREQLALLRSMGFENSKNNLSALVACQGNIEETIEHLKNKQG